MRVAPNLMENRLWHPYRTLAGAPAHRVRTTIAPHVLMMIVCLVLAVALFWAASYRSMPQNFVDIFDQICRTTLPTWIG